MYSLAVKLNKTLSEIEAMPVDEFVGWVAFFEITKPE
ncbi:hypothetical protein phi3LM21_p41 [Sinorhizobium phage phi3LM21]|nr:hypothetical protein phi3LM21_p41 [Sinorhizobium phage phi3LM21]